MTAISFGSGATVVLAYALRGRLEREITAVPALELVKDKPEEGELAALQAAAKAKKS